MTAIIPDRWDSDLAEQDSPQTQPWADAWSAEISSGDRYFTKQDAAWRIVGGVGVATFGHERKVETTLDSDPLVTLPALSERSAWALLVALGLISGAALGVSLANQDFFLEVPTALLLVLGTVGLALTLRRWSRSRRPGR